MDRAARHSVSGHALSTGLQVGVRPYPKLFSKFSKHQPGLPILRQQVRRCSKGPDTASAVRTIDQRLEDPQPSGQSSDEDDLPVGLQLATPAASASNSKATLLASLGLVGGLVLLLGGGYVFKDQISAFLDFFIAAVDDWGPLGYVAYAAVYTGLEVLAVPAIPLTMTAGVIFGVIPGTLLVSVAGTLAATIAFLIARYAARDKVLKWAGKNPKFAAIDKAIGKDGFKFVTLLRLSPLLPLAVSNYIYGLTSVNLVPYILGSWVGMLPGTWAYVSAGSISKVVLTEGHGALGVESWQIALGVGFTLVAIGFVGQLAKKAIQEADETGQLTDDDAK